MRTIYKSDLPFIIEECQSYIDQCLSYEQDAYQTELNQVCGHFGQLVDSGIFHDAIGKVAVKKFTANGEDCLEVGVTTEY